MLFAYKTQNAIVQANLNQILLIKRTQMPRFFFQHYVRDINSFCYMVSPIHEYRPHYEFRLLFNVYRIKELMYCLDFRKSNVKSMGSRLSWMEAIDLDFRSILNFGLFYKMLISSGKNIWTPTYNEQIINSGTVFV